MADKETPIKPPVAPKVGRGAGSRKVSAASREVRRPMRIAVLGGGGAMGGLFGGWLQRSGQDVALIRRLPQSAAAINDAELSIEEKDGNVAVIPVRATNDPKSVGPVDLIVNFVKCYHTEAAVGAAESMLGPETSVLTLQNGWGNAERIAKIIGEDRVLVGLTIIAAPCLPRPSRTFGRRNDLHWRTERPGNPAFAAGRRRRCGRPGSRQRSRRESSTKSGRNWRSTPAPCRQRRCCASSPTSSCFTTTPGR